MFIHTPQQFLLFQNKNIGYRTTVSITYFINLKLIFSNIYFFKIIICFLQHIVHGSNKNPAVLGVKSYSNNNICIFRIPFNSSGLLIAMTEICTVVFLLNTFYHCYIIVSCSILQNKRFRYFSHFYEP